MNNCQDTKLKVLIVDDYEDNCELLEAVFSDDYDVSSVYSGQSCLDALSENHFDIVLLDVSMPGLDGYEVCKKIKSTPQTAQTAVVFVSALTSTEERLRGYEVGGEDYITKPFSPDNVLAVVERVLEIHIQYRNMEKQSKEAMSTAFQAMTNSSEMGQIIHFLQASYESKSVESLADGLFQTLSGFGLKACALFLSQYQKKIIGCEATSIEAKVLERFHNTERILDFGARTLLSDNNVSILIKNMPIHKPDDYGRIKDNLIAIINGTQSRCQALELEFELENERNRGLQSVLVKSRENLTSIRKLIDEQRESTGNVLIDINNKVEAIIFSLGLDEEQERAILDAIDQGVEELSRLTHSSEKIESNFKGFVEELNKLVQ